MSTVAAAGPDPEKEPTAALTVDDPFILIMYSIHQLICTQEKENAELKRRREELNTEVPREEKAVGSAEEWVQQNQEHLAKLEDMVLAEEQKVDQHLASPPEETQQDEVFMEGQRLQAALDGLTWKLEHPEMVEEEDGLGLIQGYEETYGPLDPGELPVEQEEKVLEVDAKETDPPKKKKKKRNIFSALWSSRSSRGPRTDY